MMRAKLEVRKVEPQYHGPDNTISHIDLEMAPVCGKAPFGPDGESEDNTYARWTPSGTVSLTITNPNLFDKFKQGQKFYADFTEVSE